MSQTQKILDRLKEGKSITPLEALQDYGCFRLGARIWELKKMGYNVRSEIVTENDKSFAKYSLEVTR
jgi:hypothetical protein